MAIVSAFGILQGLMPIFMFDKYVANFGLSVAHPSTEAMVKLMLTMWGMCVAAGSIARLGVNHAAHTDSIYAACRAMVLYLSQMVGSLAIVKSLGKCNSESMGYQCLIATFYTFLLYFGGTIADDTAAAEAKNALSKGKKKK